MPLKDLCEGHYEIFIKSDISQSKQHFRMEEPEETR